MTDVDEKLWDNVVRTASKVLLTKVHSTAPAYHYTTAASLWAIVESEAIRLTDYRFLNDPSEYEYAVQLIQRCLRKRIERKGARYREEMEAALQYFGDEPRADFFVFSLSETDRSLNCWRAYGSDGLGFAIGIRHHEKLLGAWGKGNNVYFGRILYGPGDQERLVKAIISAFIGAYRREGFDPSSRELAGALLHIQLLLSAAFIKEYAYHDEREVRYVFWRHKEMDKASEIRVAVKGDLFRPFVSMPFPLVLVDDITGGPCQYPVDNQRHPISLLLPGAEWSQCDIPYRP